jgi:hypothetical protein
MRRRLTGQRGSVLPIAVIVMSVLMGLGLAIYSSADFQVAEGTRESGREATFNLSEGVLKQQVFLLSKNWPGSVGTAYPACTQASTAGTCPDNTTVLSNFTATDYAAGYSWSSTVQDNGIPVSTYYTTAGAASQPGYDANGDGKVWVRAQSTVRSRPRTIVALVKAELVPIPFPRNAVTAGKFATGNTGNKVIVDTNGFNDGQSGDIQVRCVRATDPTCAVYRDGQLAPDTVHDGYPNPYAVSDSEFEGLRGIAKSNGTYYASGCPASMAGAMVFVENGNCSYSSGTANSAASPGMFVINNGTLTMSANSTYYGLVYARNAQASSGTVVTLTGTSLVQGSVAVDGDGGVSVGNSALNLVFDPNVFGAVKGYGNAGLSHGYWRELVGS